MIRVLVVDDSPSVRKLLIHILGSDPGLQVIGAVGDGEDAVEAVRRNKPDIVTMDVYMPKMDGFNATRTIMETNPVPIIIVTGSLNVRETEMSFRAIEAGALTVLSKPHGIGHPDYERRARELIDTVKLMAEVKVVRRWSRNAEKWPPREAETYRHTPFRTPAADIRVVAIGASTGGPPVIQMILSGLPGDFSAPVLIVQHMAEGFIQGFAEWLNQTSALPVHVAVHDGRILPGQVYVAPNGRQMKVEPGGRISLTEDGPENGMRPSVACLFRSVADVFGKNAVGILLTGMGRDGAEELRLMKEKGAVTIAQDEESCVVFGMPGEAVRLNAAIYVLPPEKIAAALAKVSPQSGTGGREYRGGWSQAGPAATE